MFKVSRHYYHARN